MTILIAIDPGNVSGFAVFTDGRLTAAWSASPDAEDGQVVGDIAVIECPTRAFAGISPKSIFTLSRTAGRYIERYRRLQQHLVEPRDWKGTVDGDIMTARIRAALTPSEQAICSLCNYDHNMLDAVGLGKWALRQPWMRVLTKQADR